MTLYTDIDPYCCEVLRARVADGGLPPGDVHEGDVCALDANALAGYTHIHLFCGIGGIPLGLKWAGWPADWSVVTGGFPCQDVSVAGKGLGVEGGARSGLWMEMHRVIDLVRPSRVIVENVSALRTRGADRVLGDLERSGYAATPLVVGADDVGAPHRRKRVWIVGVADPQLAGRGARSGVEGHEGREGRGGRESARGVQLADTPRGGLGTDGRARRGDGHTDEFVESVANSGSRRQQAAMQQPSDGKGPDRHGQAGVAGSDDVEHTERAGREERNPAAFADSTRLRGWPMPPGPEQHGWEAQRLTQSGVGAAVDGLPRRVAGYLRRSGLKACGNAVVPQVVEVIARAMKATASGEQTGAQQ